MRLRSETLAEKTKEQNTLMEVYEARLKQKENENADKHLAEMQANRAQRLQLAKEQRNQMRFKRQLLEKELAQDIKMQKELQLNDKKEK